MLGVVESAEKLALLYGESVETARMAALLHDCAKELPLRSMQDLTLVDYPNCDAELLASGALLHGLAGSCMAMHRYGITDENILEAIRVHTTGKVGMSILDKIVFLADYIEPNRDFPGVEPLRNMSEKSLDRAILLAYDTTLRHLLDQGLSIYYQTILGRNDIIYILNKLNA